MSKFMLEVQLFHALPKWTEIYISYFIIPNSEKIQPCIFVLENFSEGAAFKLCVVF